MTMMSRPFFRRCVVSASLALAALGMLIPAHADTTAQVRERFEAVFPGMKVDGVTRTEYGLYEVQLGSEIVYTDEPVSYVLQGTLIDTATRSDVTRARLEKLLAVPFEQLPLELAFTQVRGAGSSRIAIFEDPNCGYCKQLRRTLLELDDITIHTFMYPILSPDSADKVEPVWCARDKAATWDAWMLQNRAPEAASCEAPLKALVELGQRLNVRGTPTIIFQDGSRASGALPLAALQARIRQAGQ
jgi:thiol:disulfide interchange protein DsbC